MKSRGSEPQVMDALELSDAELLACSNSTGEE